jgi:hypothetical protein
MRMSMRLVRSIWHRIIERAWLLIVRRDVDLVEIYSGLLMLGWGIQLLLPWDTFTTAQSYQAMAVLFTEESWGVLLGTVGLLQLGAYIFNTIKLRLVASVAACMIWSFIGALFGISNIQGVGWIVYVFLAMVCALVFWRIRTRRVPHE